jgi:hypothetical protein
MANEIQCSKVLYYEVITKRLKQTTQYSLGGSVLSQVESHPYLGVEIQRNLHWDNHIDKIIGKSSKTLGMIKRNLWGCNSETKALAYKSLVRPQLEYASAVWDPHLKKHCYKLDMVQRRSARFVMRDYRYTSSPSEMISKLGWQDLAVRRENARLNMLFKAIHGTAKLPLTDLHRPTRLTRNSTDLTFMPLGSRCDTFKFSFFPRTIVGWNKLPSSVISSPSLDSFQSSLAQHRV